LYGGDHVSLGKTIEIEDISINAKRDMRTYGIVIPSSMMATELIKVRGITYRTESKVHPLHSLQLLYEVLKISFNVQFS
jgi:hypothetical protein